jgi:hypothetical protein
MRRTTPLPASLRRIDRARVCRNCVVAVGAAVREEYGVVTSGVVRLDHEAMTVAATARGLALSYP